MAWRESGSAWAFLAFPLAIVFLFTAIPSAAGVVLSLFQWSGQGEPRFLGAGNYEALLGAEPFWPAVRNTLLIAIATVPATVVGAFLIAVPMHAEWFRGRTTARTVFFIPSIISIVAIGFIWRWVLNSGGNGLLNHALLEMGLIDDPVTWLGNGPVGLASIVGVTIWRNLGFAIVLYLAALGSVPRSLYDAAAVDGAGSWQMVRHITWPGVKPMTVFLVITGMIGALQTFDLVLVMIGPIPQAWTDVLNLFLYREFTRDRLGFAAAIGVVILLLTIGVTAAQWWWFRRRDGGGLPT